MTSRELVQSVEEGDALKFDSISERCVYLYMRFHADKKGVFRLAMTELASLLNVNRQTVLKHVDTLMAKNLVKRTGHGRYVVYAAPMTLERVTLDYLKDLAEGETALSEDVERLFYGDVLPYADSPGYDERGDAITEALMACNRRGLLLFNEYSGELTRTAKPV